MEEFMNGNSHIVTDTVLCSVSVTIWLLPFMNSSIRKGFFYFHTPIITASDCEGAGQMFQSYYDEPL